MLHRLGQQVTHHPTAYLGDRTHTLRVSRTAAAWRQAQEIRQAPASREQAQAEVRSLLVWRPVVLDAEVLEAGWKIQERFKISFWDALIVAAAKAASCHSLLTEDLQEGQDFDGVVVVNPFHIMPGEISQT